MTDPDLIMTDPDLIPPDFSRCQCETRELHPFALGKEPYVRCVRKPVWIAVEMIAGKDGKHGAMSLCMPCAEKMMEDKDLRVRVQLQIIEDYKTACAVYKELEGST